MRSETRIKALDITAQIEQFFAQGGIAKTAPLGDGLRPDDGETWQQQNRRRWAARQEREAAK
jgi:hypothetical protein